MHENNGAHSEILFDGALDTPGPSWGALGHLEAFLPVSLHLRQTGSFWALHVSKMPQGGTACLILVFFLLSVDL